MADISINFIYLNGDESILSFPCDFTFHDLNKDESYISLFHIGDYVYIDKHVLLSNYSDQTIYVIKKQRDTLLPWIDKLIQYSIKSRSLPLHSDSEQLSANTNAISFLEQNINSFKILFKNIVDEKKEEINYIKIDNPQIVEIIKLFI